MADRPETPGLITTLRNHERRLTDVEREVLFPDEADGPLQTYEDGELLGDTRYLNFGPGVFGKLIGDRYVEISALTGGAGFDAVVDFAAGESDTNATPPVFIGIGEALSYLAPLLSRAFVLVRATAPSGYVETGNWTNPNEVHLFGLKDDTQAVASDNRPLWDHAGFSGSNAGWELHDMQVNFGNKPTGFATASGTNRFYAEHTYFRTDNSVVIQIANHANETYVDCMADYMCNLGVNVKLVRFAFGDATNVYTVTLADTSLIGDWTVGVTITGPATTTVNLPNFTRGRSTILGSGSGNGVLTYANSAAGAEVNIEGYDDGICRQALSIGALNQIRIRGTWTKIVVGSCAQGADVECRVTETGHDITGPGMFNIIGLENNMKIRGEAGTGVISFQNTNGNLGAAVAVLDFIDADGWALVFAGDNNGFTGKPYAFDASSNNNVILAKDLTTFANAGTDAGTGNRVLPEGSAAFTTNGHVIEDEGTPLTQRANLNFVGAGVTVTDSAPDTIVTIPGGGGSGDTLVAWVGL